MVRRVVAARIVRIALYGQQAPVWRGSEKSGFLASSHTHDGVCVCSGGEIFDSGGDKATTTSMCRPYVGVERGGIALC